MSKKIDRAAHGPSLAEIVIGVILSVVLGVLAGAVLLILRPVVVAKEMPKEKDRDPRAIYYIEGSRDTAKAKQALAKRKAFVEGQSIVATEDEINTIANPTAPATPAAGKAGEKKGPEKKGDPKAKEKEKEKEAPPPANSDEMLAVGAPNVRLNGGDVQLGVPVTINALGLGQRVIMQAHGGFVKKDNVFVYEPETIYFGSCPIQRLPFLAGYLRGKVLDGVKIPEDIKASWAKVTNVAVEGNSIKLTMP